MPYSSVKQYGHELGLSCCFRQWKAESHCNRLHGYSLAIRLEFEADELDEQNWVVDFGSLKTFKEWLDAMFDHKTLVADDDPQRALFREMEIAGLCDVVWIKATGCEAFAKMIYNQARAWLSFQRHSPRVRIASVEVKEHGANSAIYRGR